LAKKGEAEAKKAASALDGYELILKEKASGKGIFYAAVNARTVAVALKKAGYAVTPEMVGLADPIKEATEQEVTVSFPHGFEANIKLIVEANT
jgi:ribosomal protein L9